MNYYLSALTPILIVASSAALYHVSSKTLGGIRGINAWFTLSLTYFFCFTATGLLSLVSRATAAPARLADYSSAWPYTLLLGLACVGIEGGYLLAYRSGSAVVNTSAAISSASIVAVFSVGLFFFKESLSWSSTVGIILIFVGVGLLQWR